MKRVAVPERLSRRWPDLPAVARQAIGRTLRDGAFHAGHLAYFSIVTLFPLTILITAVTAAFGETDAGRSAIAALLDVLPDTLSELFRPAITEVLQARTGWLLWAGGLVALWTVTSFVESLRDLSFRAFGVTPHGFVVRRLQSLAGTLIAILLASGIFVLQLMTAVLARLVRQLLHRTIGLPAWIDRASMLDLLLRFSQLLTPVLLFLALWALLKLLTPQRFKYGHTWPGALVAVLLWTAGSLLLAPGLTMLFDLGLTYGALSSVMFSMLFFYFAGFSLVLGVQLNAALALAASSRSP